MRGIEVDKNVNKRVLLFFLLVVVTIVESRDYRIAMKELQNQRDSAD